MSRKTRTWAECMRYGSVTQWRGDDALDHRLGCECAECDQYRKEFENQQTQGDDDAYHTD